MEAAVKSETEPGKYKEVSDKGSIKVGEDKPAPEKSEIETITDKFEKDE